jgi:hypothetical protein
VQLLGEVSEPDSMMRLNQTLGVIIARVEGHVSASDESVPRTLDLHILTARTQNAADCAVLAAARRHPGADVANLSRESFPDFDPRHFHQAVRSELFPQGCLIANDRAGIDVSLVLSQALGEQSQPLQPQACQIIRSSVDPTNVSAHHLVSSRLGIP